LRRPHDLVGLRRARRAEHDEGYDDEQDHVRSTERSKHDSILRRRAAGAEAGPAGGVDRNPLVPLHFRVSVGMGVRRRGRLVTLSLALLSLAAPLRADIPVVELTGVVHAISAAHVVHAL